jgi:16S rRNA (uracil1498-N3)-methyltransferase
MEFFYAPPEFITLPTLKITGEEFSHMTHVMRMSAGDRVRVVDGQGNSYEAVITMISRREAECRVTAHALRLHEPARSLTLGVGMLKNPSRFDYLVEKAVEIGVARIVPLLTERTIPRHSKTERWQKLCVAAMKQSGRCVLPEVGEPVRFVEFISSCDTGALRMIPHEQAEVSLGSLCSNGSAPAVVCVGPEGGFSNDEVDSARDAGFQPVTLGTRRLRTETAALVACALLLAEF